MAAEDFPIILLYIATIALWVLAFTVVGDA